MTIRHCKKLHEFMVTEKQWTTHNFIRDSNGKSLPRPKSSEDMDQVCSCCIEGGISVIYDNGGYFEAQKKLRKHLGVVDLTKWNDDPSRTFEEVRDAIVATDV